MARFWQARKPASPQAWKPGSLEAWKPGSLEARKPGSLEAWKPGSLEACAQALPMPDRYGAHNAKSPHMGALFALLHRSYRSRVPQSISLKMSHTMRMISTGCSAPIGCTIALADQASPVRKRVNEALRVKRRSDCALRSLSIHNFHDSGNYLGQRQRMAYRRIQA